MKMVIKLLASHFDLTVLTEILIHIIKRFPSLAVQKSGEMFRPILIAQHFSSH